MPVLVWRHGTTQADAVGRIRAAVRAAGREDAVTWTGPASASVRVGPFGSVLSAAAVVTGEAVVIERCGGLTGAVALDRARGMLERLFPGGGPDAG